jgi:hypothetical protein
MYCQPSYYVIGLAAVKSRSWPDEQLKDAADQSQRYIYIYFLDTLLIIQSSALLEPRPTLFFVLFFELYLPLILSIVQSVTKVTLSLDQLLMEYALHLMVQNI